MKHSALRKNALIEISKTKSRFLSIFGIVAIGVAFFSGVKSASPDMKLSADEYFDEQSLMDYRLVSTIGFDDEDVEAVRSVDAPVTVYPTYFTDALVQTSSGNKPARIEAVTEGVNQLILQEGRMPESENECVIMGGGYMGGFSVGDKISFLSGTDSELSDTLKNAEYKIVGKYLSSQYIDKSNLGSTTVGSGSINAVVYIPQSNFTVDYYTELYIVANNLTDINCYSEEYERISEEISAKLEVIGDQRSVTRYNEIISEANEKITDAETELSDKTKDADEEFADAWQEILDAKDKLDDAENELTSGRNDLDDAKITLENSRKELDNGWISLADAKEEYAKQINDAEKAIEENQAKITDGLAQYEAGLAEYESGLAQYNDGLAQYTDGLTQYQAGLESYNENLTAFEPAKSQYEEGLAAYNEGMAQLEALQVQLNEAMAQLEQLKAAFGENNPQYIVAKAQYDAGVATYETNYQQLAAAKAQLDVSAPVIEETMAQLEAAKIQLDETGKQLSEAKTQLDESKKALDEAEDTLSASKKELSDGQKQLDEAKEQLEEAKTDGQKQLDEAEKELNDGEIKYADGYADYEQGEADYASGLAEYEQGVLDYKAGIDEYNKNKKDYEKQIKDAEKEIADAKKELSDLSDPKWYVFDRSDNAGYTEYSENADRIDNISKVFPIFFLIVAGLVCLTTMTRMVEEERTQIGTLKALGYTNGQIIFKYMLYAIAATLAGCIGGVLIGEKLFPIVIIVAYSMLYNMPVVSTPYDWSLGGIAAIVCAVAVIITVYFSCRTELNEQPAQLMRPKPPKSGKRVLLERIPFIWKHFSFSNKVTCRNIFRYKRRMLMTVIGIAGCTALMLMGFGLKDSISDIVSKQFGEIMNYSGIVAYDNAEISDDGLAEVQGNLDNIGSSIKLYQKQFNVNFADSKNVAAYVMVTDDSEHFGEFLTLRDRTSHESYALTSNGVIIDEKLSRLIGCNAGDTITLSTDTADYQLLVEHITENYAQHYVYMTEEMYIKLFENAPEYNMVYFKNDISADSEDRLAETIMDVDGVLAVNFNSGSAETFDAMLQALNMVIVVIIAAAGVLAFVVLYNLTNININERIREIATLKVLGFYDKEVDSYIFRENIILTMLGAAVGLVLGTFLAQFIITTAEVDIVMFGRDVYPLSYFLAAAMTMVFSLLVSLFMHRYLKKVNMIEALKSVE